MQNKKRQKWIAISKKGRNLPILLLDTLAFIFNKDFFAKYHHTHFYPKYYRQFNQARWFGVKDYKNYTNLFKALVKKPIQMNSVIKKNKECIQRIRLLKLKQIDFSKLSNKDLIYYFNKFLDPFSKINIFVYDYMILNEILTPQLYKIISKSTSDLVKKEEYAQFLSRPKRPSDSSRAELLFNKIYKKYKKGENIDKEIDQYLRKFAHLGLYTFYGKPLIKKDILARIKLMKGTSIKKPLKKLSYRAIIKKLKINKEEQKIVELIREYASLATEIQEAANYSVYQTWNLWKEITKRLKIPLDHLFQMRIKEIIEGLRNNKLSYQLKIDLKKRAKDSVYLFDDGKITILIGEKLTRYYQKNRPKITKNIQFLKGQIACPGKLQGKIKVIIDLNKLKDFKKDEILVAACTTPAYGVVLQKAKAIITDTGGLLSHAAIVSRELNKPCIIGTKIATKVLKDGDLVEVDANKGIVTILRKA